MQIGPLCCISVTKRAVIVVKEMDCEPRVSVSVANTASAVFCFLFSLQVYLKAIRINIMLLPNTCIASQDVVIPA